MGCPPGAVLMGLDGIVIQGGDSRLGAIQCFGLDAGILRTTLCEVRAPRKMQPLLSMTRISQGFQAPRIRNK